MCDVISFSTGLMDKYKLTMDPKVYSVGTDTICAQKGVHMKRLRFILTLFKLKMSFDIKYDICIFNQIQH